MWKAAAEVSGYQQQDAHEFFIAALNQIHASSRGSTSISCVCVVHSTFAGQLQSDVQCTKCGNVTTQTDLVLDISLDLGGKLGKDDNTLAGCLRRCVSSSLIALPTQPANIKSLDSRAPRTWSRGAANASTPVTYAALHVGDLRSGDADLGFI